MKQPIVLNLLTIALLSTAVFFVSCSSDEEPTTTEEVKKTTFTMTVEASLGGNQALTRALSLENNTLKATWAASDKVLVYEGETKIGELTATESATASTTLTGTLTQEPTGNLTFYYHQKGVPDYSTQTGTLAGIAENFDYCTPAEVTTGNYTKNGNKITVPGGIAFGANQQAIVKFTLKNADGSATLSASKLMVSDGSHTYTVTPTEATSEIYVAIPGFSGQTIRLRATVSDKPYVYERSGVTFENSKYYAVGVKFTYNEIKDMSGSTNVGVPAGEHYLIKGAKEGVTITLHEGSTATLSGVNVTADAYKYIALYCEGNATLILKGSNTLTGSNYAGIEVAEGKKLSISGTGSLTVNGYDNVAIKGSYEIAGTLQESTSGNTCTISPKQ